MGDWTNCINLKRSTGVDMKSARLVCDDPVAQQQYLYAVRHDRPQTSNSASPPTTTAYARYDANTRQQIATSTDCLPPGVPRKFYENQPTCSAPDVIPAPPGVDEQLPFNPTAQSIYNVYLADLKTNPNSQLAHLIRATVDLNQNGELDSVAERSKLNFLANTMALNILGDQIIPMESSINHSITPANAIINDDALFRDIASYDGHSDAISKRDLMHYIESQDFVPWAAKHPQITSAVNWAAIKGATYQLASFAIVFFAKVPVAQLVPTVAGTTSVGLVNGAATGVRHANQVGSDIAGQHWDAPTTSLLVWFRGAKYYKTNPSY